MSHIISPMHKFIIISYNLVEKMKKKLEGKSIIIIIVVDVYRIFY
jgi:hypothetical protein